MWELYRTKLIPQYSHVFSASDFPADFFFMVCSGEQEMHRCQSMFRVMVEVDACLRLIWCTKHFENNFKFVIWKQKTHSDGTFELLLPHSRSPIPLRNNLFSPAFFSKGRDKKWWNAYFGLQIVVINHADLINSKNANFFQSTINFFHLSNQAICWIGLDSHCLSNTWICDFDNLSWAWWVMGGGSTSSGAWAV